MSGALCGESSRVDQAFAAVRCVRAARSRGPHWHGAPCWQPHWQDEATAAGVWQPQVQLAPTQGVHEQFFMGVFIAMLQMEWQAGIGLSAFWIPVFPRS